MEGKKWIVAGAIVAVAAMTGLLAAVMTPTKTWAGYDDAWKAVDSLDRISMPESALKLVNEIYDHAKAENISPQIIKSLIYRGKYTNMLEEDGEEKAIALFEKEIAISDGVTKAVLQSLTANLYWQYYSNNRWQISQRTQTEELLSNDIATWDIKALLNKTNELYNASLSQRELLKKTPSTLYVEILLKGNAYGQFLRPTMFDLLGNEALSFYMNSESTLDKPAYAVNIANPILLESAKQFSGYSFNAADSVITQLPAVRILQELTTAHLYDPYPDALIDLNLSRYLYAKNILSIANVDSLYLQALERDEKQYARDSSSARISLAIATWHMGKRYQYQPLEGDAYKWELRTAETYLNKAIAAFPKSYGGILCKLELNELVRKRLEELNIEQEQIPGAPILASIKYTNVDKIHLQLLKASANEIVSISSMDYSDRKAALKKLVVERSWTQNLIVDGDLQSHRVEFKIDALGLGSYFLLASANDNWMSDSADVYIRDIWVTNMAYIAESGNGDESDYKRFYVVDRTSGLPMKGVNVTTFRNDYDYSTHKYKESELQKFVTDGNGMFELRDPIIRNTYSFGFTLQNGKDILKTNKLFSIAKSQTQPDREIQHTILFTDRAIYRPGQTVYFKGIMYSETAFGRTKEVLKNHKTTVRFFDVNYQEVGNLELVSNDFGSFSGSFTAPASGLTGQMQISNETGAVYFSVEEYKRPTFYVELEDLKGDYILNDTISVNGTATAYSGAVIDNAQIQYRVVRSVHMPYWYGDYYFRKSYPVSNADQEIVSGVSATDAEGKFVIPFVAKSQVENVSGLQYTYTVYVDVTDVSGETRSSQTNVTVGKINLQLRADVKDAYPVNSDIAIKITTHNLNGQPLPATGKVTIFAIDAPKRLMRYRLWDTPDLHLMSEADFIKQFPRDQYATELDAASWKTGDALASDTWNTKENDSVLLPTQGLKQGVYRVVFEALDKSGETVRSEHTINLLNDGSYAAYPEYFHSVKSENSVEPGNSAIVQVGSSTSGSKALVLIKRYHQPTKAQWVSMMEVAGKKSGVSMMDLEIPVSENDRGGIGVQVMMIKDGREFSKVYNITVPWTNKQLQVKLETFRDKLQPGAKETWKIQVSGEKSDMVSAELLASMYDASLDAFRTNYWGDVYYPANYLYTSLSAEAMGQSYGWQHNGYFNYYATYPTIEYNQLNWFGFSLGRDYRYFYGNSEGMIDQRVVLGNVSISNNYKANAPLEKQEDTLVDKMNDGDGRSEMKKGFAIDYLGNEPDAAPITKVPVRTNFSETAFFFPQLETDSLGNVSFSFTMPDALTTWKFMAYAHTKDLQTGSAMASVITQKELMIQANMPRFLREGDHITLAAKISNLTDKDISGSAQLELFNAVNMQPVNAVFENKQATVSFTASAKGSTSVQWEVHVPEGIDAIVYRVKAGNETFSDGEENGLPVLTNKILVTESIPLWVRGGDSKSFVFDKLLKSGNSSTLRNQNVTLEYTSNPAWYAVQALPYMMEYPYECAEQVFSRFYANSIAAHIVNSDPEIKRVFDSWKKNPSSLVSNLEKNEELKSLMLEETPWVLQAQNETERKKRVALLFDVNKMQSEQRAALQKLQKMQLPDGAWPWFSGYKDDPYITQYIVTGLAHLERLSATEYNTAGEVDAMLRSAMPYCSANMYETYTRLEKNKVEKSSYVPDNLILQYLYAASYFDEKRFPLTKNEAEAKAYFIAQIKTYWTSYSLYQKGMIAIILNRNDQVKTAQQIVASLKENSIKSEEMGMYWKSNIAGYYWYQAPIETQALMIEVFAEVANDKNAVDALQIWLLRQKQTTDWKTTRATAEACYALLSRGLNLLANTELANITIGNLQVKPEQTELGTGYFKSTWLGTNINPAMGNITITPPANNLLSYGAMYWQYFEEMDKVTSAETNLKLKKQLFLEVNSASGPVLRAVDEKTELHVGDKVIVRIELKSDRDMEYVHMKDMRASGFEPTNVISSYKWQDGLGYYEATGDASTNFFISYLRKGTYVFEYPVRVSHKGSMSNGITSIQCMYAPEFSSHSEGSRVTVK